MTPVSTSVYTVTISGITGDGTLGLNLVDDGSIRDVAGNPFAPAKCRGRVRTPGDVCHRRWPGIGDDGDVNWDGKPDLAVANNGSNTVSVLLGNGNGTFQAQQNFATGLIRIR